MNFKAKLIGRDILKSIKQAKKGQLYRMKRQAGRLITIKCRPRRKTAP